MVSSAAYDLNNYLNKHSDKLADEYVLPYLKKNYPSIAGCAGAVALATSRTIEKILPSCNRMLQRFSSSTTQSWLWNPRTLSESLEWLSNCLPQFNEQLSIHIEKQNKEGWQDPVPSEAILAVNKFVKPYLLKMSMRKPLDRDKPLEFIGQENDPLGQLIEKDIRLGLHYLDQVAVSHAQYLYPQIKEVDFCLKIPIILKTYAANFSFDNLSKWVASFNGRIFVWINNIYLGLKKLVLLIIDFIIDLVDFVLQSITFNYEFGYLTYLREVVRAARDHINSKFIDIALKTIDSREKVVRKKVVENVFDVVLPYSTITATRVAVKTLVGGFVYWNVSPILSNTFNVPSIAVHALGAAALGTLIWKNVCRPFLDPFYESYSDKFDPKQSQLRQFCDEYSLSYFYIPLKMMQDFFKSTKLHEKETIAKQKI